MKYTKMMTITTKPVFMGYKMVHAFTIKENEQPEKIIAKLTGFVDRIRAICGGFLSLGKW